MPKGPVQRSGGRFFENLAHLVPGLDGYRHHGQRQEADSRLRARLLQKLTALRGAMVETTNGLAELNPTSFSEHLEARMERLEDLADAIRYAPYGFTGFFQPHGIREDLLERILEIDLLLFEDLDALETNVESIQIRSRAGPLRPELLADLDEMIQRFESHLVMRDKLLGDA